jgi:hypothetical protein
VRDLHERINAIWAKYRNNKEALVNSVNDYIGIHLNEAINKYHKESGCDERAKGDRAKESRKAKSNRKAINNRKRRLKFARSQELFKKCPRKLADIIINNDISLLEPIEQPLRAEEIEESYKKLWGTAGPPNVMAVESSTDECQTGETFPPVTDEEIVDRIKKLRNKTAAGPDGFQKKASVNSWPADHFSKNF